jgi:hypothetical protein
VASLKRLIQGQDVAFDTHQAGDSQVVKADDLHLEKRMHRGGGKVRFPLFGDRQPSRSERVSDKDFARIVREVHKALSKKPQLQSQLAEVVVEQINRFRGGQITTEQCMEGARKLADIFDLGEPFLVQVRMNIDLLLLEVATLHAGISKGAVVEIVQSRYRIEIQRPNESWPNWRRPVKFVDRSEE